METSWGHGPSAQRYPSFGVLFRRPGILIIQQHIGINMGEAAEKPQGLGKKVEKTKPGNHGFRCWLSLLQINPLIETYGKNRGGHGSWGYHGLGKPQSEGSLGGSHVISLISPGKIDRWEMMGHDGVWAVWGCCPSNQQQTKGICLRFPAQLKGHGICGKLTKSTT